MSNQRISIADLTKWHWLWRWDKIKVRIINDRKVRFSYERCVVNSPTYYVEVKLGFFERRRGIKLEDKAKDELAKLVRRLKNLNNEIIIRQEMEKEIKASIKGDEGIWLSVKN
jgi:ABC-type transporter lipoprotein component MlaA